MLAFRRGEDVFRRGLNPFSPKTEETYIPDVTEKDLQGFLG